MSTAVMSACWPLQMPHAAKSVLISLADNANDQGECWPSIDYIAKRTCLHRSNVINAIKKLEQLGHVVADRTNGRHTRYTITPNLDLFNDAKPVAKRDPSRSTTGSETRLNPSRSATGPVAERDTNRQEPSRTNGVSVARDGAVQASIELRMHGVRVTPSNPDLIAAVSEGVTPTHLGDVAAAHPDKPAGYVIAIARREHAEGAKKIEGTTNANRTTGRKQSAVEQVQQAIRDRRTAAKEPPAD